jgi:hypothetical protein
MELTVSSKSYEERIKNLRPLLEDLLKANSAEQKLRILQALDSVKGFQLAKAGPLSIEDELAIYSVLAIGQGPTVLVALRESEGGDLNGWRRLLDTLVEIDQFYQEIGGIVGYHVKMLDLMNERQEIGPVRKQEFTKPPGIDLSKDVQAANHCTAQGLKCLSTMGELYPIGGAGDRLGLIDEITGEALPAALLMFCGRSLIEGLIRDLQAREYLYYKIFGEQLQTPIALMTSLEKNNHQHLLDVFEKNRWFGRTKESVTFFTQPLVPLVTPEGNWVMKDLYDIALKPSGHGVIWKLARDSGVFQWFRNQGRDRLLVRQINNPMAGLDLGILAFIGQGCKHDKAFGYLSCPRRVGSAEGVLVLTTSIEEKGRAYRVSNLEYTSFPLHGIEDIPETEGSHYSLYPSNTNILFVNLNAIENAIKDKPFPGLLVNVKTGVNAFSAHGEIQEVKAGRLESTMQNISDQITTLSDSPLSGTQLEEKLKAFVVYNERTKTISVTKSSYMPGKSIQETPEGAYYDLLKNMYDLLTNHCRFILPAMQSSSEYLTQGPDFFFLFHPALGPLYHVIAQKMRGGTMHKGAELQLEIAELDVENLDLDGSLLVFASSAIGQHDADGRLHYSHSGGKCRLRNVKIINKGRRKQPDQVFWKNQILRHEALKIVLHGNAEFEASDMTISGSHDIDVPDGHRMVAYENQGELSFRLEKINQPTWYWNYSLNSEDNVVLKQSRL